MRCYIRVEHCPQQSGRSHAYALDNVREPFSRDVPKKQRERETCLHVQTCTGERWHWAAFLRQMLVHSEPSEILFGLHSLSCRECGMRSHGGCIPQGSCARFDECCLLLSWQRVRFPAWR